MTQISRTSDFGDSAAKIDDLRQTAKDAADKAGSAASSIASDARNSVGAAYSSGVEAASGAISGARSTISNAASDASKALKDTIEDHKTSGAEAVASLARSARDSADGFEAQAPQLANVVRNVANRVETASNDVKDLTVNDMVDSISSFARRQPIAFLGCGIVAGLVLARLLTPSNRA